MSLETDETYVYSFDESARGAVVVVVVTFGECGRGAVVFVPVVVVVVVTFGECVRGAVVSDSWLSFSFSSCLLSFNGMVDFTCHRRSCRFE